MQEALDTLTILISCAMLGNEFAVAAFVHPSFSKLSESAHQQAAAKLAAILGRYMPFWYALTLLLAITGLAFRWHTAHQVNTGLLVACALWLIAIVSSIIWLVPINNRIASGTTQSPSLWLADRKRWDLLHRWRVLLLSIAAACLVVGVLHSP
jgi:anthrone oxygenase-like protein